MLKWLASLSIRARFIQAMCLDFIGTSVASTVVLSMMTRLGPSGEDMLQDPST